MPQKLLTLCHCRAAQLVLTWMRICSACFVLLLKFQKRIPGWEPSAVIWIHFSSTASDTMWVSFATWLKLPPSIVLRMLLNQLDYRYRTSVIITSVR